MEQRRMNLQLFAEEPAEAGVISGEMGAQKAALPEQEYSAEQQMLQIRFQQHFRELERQAEELKRIFHDFDLRRELKNPVFARMTAPGVGLSVEDAYYAVHRKELQNAAIQAAKRQVSNAIASGARRPRENGLSGQASGVSAFDYRNATREQREELKRRIRLAAAEGKKLYPGGN